MPDIFLSYSREDQSTARQFATALAREGFSVWWDQALDPGEAFDQVTEKALEEARAVIVLWSKTSVDSRWVRAEATQASADNRLVPVMIEACKRPIMFELTQTADLAGWDGDHANARWQSFVEGMRRFVGKSGAAASGAWSAPSGGAPTRAAPIPHAAAAVASPSAQSGSRRLPRWAIAAMAVVAGFAVIAGFLWHLQGRQQAPATAREISIAVLPFSDMSPKKDQGYFAEGVAEEILNSLARIPDPHLKVISRNSSFVFRDASNLKQVGATLGAEHVLEGSVRKAGDQLRITAQLINANTDAHLWSKTFDRPLAGVFDVQEEIARSVAQALQVSLGVGLGRDPGMTRNVEAYELLLEATSMVALFTPEHRRRLIGLLEQAVALDPSFAGAWLFLAGMYESMPTFVADDSGEWQRKAEAAFNEARRLQPDLPRLHSQLAQRAGIAGQFRAAAAHQHDAEVAAAKLGIRVETGMPGAALLNVGRTREAIAKLEQQKARDPLYAEYAFWLAHAHGEAGNFAAAYAEVERGYQLDGAWKYLMASAGLMTALGARDHGLLVHWLKLQTTIAPDAEAREINAQLLARLDKPAEALAMLHAIVRNPAATPLALSSAAPWLAYHGDQASALNALRAGRRISRGVSSLWSAAYRDLRKLDGFKQMVRDEGLVDYWREFGWADHCNPVGTDDFECH